MAIFNVFSAPLVSVGARPRSLDLPLEMGLSLVRVVLAFTFCLSIALPLAILLSRRPRAARVGLPIVEVVASFPATALFPVIIFELLPYISGEGAAVLMLMTGMMWYLFFNLLSGIRGLPPDLEEASRSFGVKGRGFFAKVLLPGVFPALITGSITAFGGGWNTLIVAEYLNVVLPDVPGAGDRLRHRYRLRRAERPPAHGRRPAHPGARGDRHQRTHMEAALPPGGREVPVRLTRPAPGSKGAGGYGWH